MVTAADGAAWEAVLLADPAVRAADVIEIVRRCVDVIELLAVASSGQATAALLDAGLRRLDQDAVQRLDAAGVAVVGVAENDADLDSLREAGVRFSVMARSDASVFAEVLASAVRELAGEEPGGRSFGDPAYATGSVLPPAGPPGLIQPFIPSGRVEPSGGATVSPASPVAGSGVAGGGPPLGSFADRPVVIAVWGPAGAPGRSTVAVTLADELARSGASSLVIDADVYGGVVATMLGLLDDSPGLVAACRQAQAHRLDPAALASLCWQLPAGLRVLTGIARADRWPEIRPTALADVLDVAGQLAAFTVVDVGFALESDEELSFDTLAPRRNGATLAVLDAADLVLVVGSADPVGMQRLVRGLAELRAAEVSAPVWIALNRVRRGSVPGKPGAELDTALRRFTGHSAAALLPYDLTSLDQAGVAGKTLGEAVPASSLRRAVAELATALTGVPAASRGRRRR